jgi:glycosyltransferase involved in cell wall biosynthesis
MRVLFSTHLFPPINNCGSETYAVALLKYLIAKGHDCRVLLHPHRGKLPEKNYIYEGIEVFPLGQQPEHHFNWADIVFCHLHFTAWTIFISKVYRKPCFHIVHSDSDKPKEVITKAELPVKIIYNSYTAAKALNYPHPAIVLQPPIRPEDYDLKIEPFKNPYITLVNLNKNKGGEILYTIARAMPERKFLAIKGSYDEQIIEDVPNVTILDNSPYILNAYKQTRILIMPSLIESFGMTAREAMCSGIPVICTETPGLKENCGDAAIYVERDDIEEWAREIRKLDTKKVYLSRSELCKYRAYNSETPEQLKALDEFIKLYR